MLARVASEVVEDPDRSEGRAVFRGGGGKEAVERGGAPCGVGCLGMIPNKGRVACYLLVRFCLLDLFLFFIMGRKIRKKASKRRFFMG